MYLKRAHEEDNASNLQNNLNWNCRVTQGAIEIEFNSEHRVVSNSKQNHKILSRIKEG